MYVYIEFASCLQYCEDICAIKVNYLENIAAKLYGNC